MLVAEDNEINRRVIIGMLERIGCDVTFAVDGREALQFVKRNDYALVFMDCQMPEMDGYESSRAIRKREEDLQHPCRWRAPVHIIAMTAHAMQGDREKCLAAGMDDYISKPVRPDELRVVLERSRRREP